MTVIRKLAAWMMLILSLIASPKSDKILISVKSATPEKVIIECRNMSLRKADLAKSFCLDKKSENGWEEVSLCENFTGFDDTVQELFPTQKGSIAIEAEKYFGKLLEKGDYRVTVTVFIEETGNTKLSTEFEIS